MRTFELSCLAPMARAHHDAIKCQRLTALNASLRKLSNAAAAALIFMKHTKGLNSDETCVFKAYIDASIDDTSNRAIAINHDIKIISSCNYKFLMIQPMVVEDDLNNYNTFMTATYLEANKDIATTCNTIEEYVNRFEETCAKMKTRAIHYSWYDIMHQYMCSWIPYWT